MTHLTTRYPGRYLLERSIHTLGDEDDESPPKLIAHFCITQDDHIEIWNKERDRMLYRQTFSAFVFTAFGQGLCGDARE